MDAAGRLSDGQLVTLLVGLGLGLLPLHQSGHAYGPIHPVHVIFNATGRPRLVDVAPPPTWTPHDDWVALLRLGRYLGASARALRLSWEGVAGLEGVDLLQWLMRWNAPEPLPLANERRGDVVALTGAMATVSATTSLGSGPFPHPRGARIVHSAEVARLSPGRHRGPFRNGNP